AVRRTSARSRGLRAAQPSKAPCAASTAALASSTLALATEAIFASVAGSITSKRWPSDDFFHLPPIHRSVGTFASRLSYMVLSLDSGHADLLLHFHFDQDVLVGRVGEIAQFVLLAGFAPDRFARAFLAAVDLAIGGLDLDLPPVIGTIA